MATAMKTCKDCGMKVPASKMKGGLCADCAKDAGSKSSSSKKSGTKR